MFSASQRWHMRRKARQIEIESESEMWKHKERKKPRGIMRDTDTGREAQREGKDRERKGEKNRCTS